MVEFRDIQFISSGLLEAEKKLLSGAAGISGKPVFILGAPRTGSTLLYQAMIHAFGLPYLSNLINQEFPQTPIIGLAIQRVAPREVGWESHFGKTEGIFGPSEGSAVMSRWFGGGHPSQTVSSRIIPGQEEHFMATLAAAERLYDGEPLLIKNAWNCFRIACLAELLPQARFIWIRRDIREAAESDLEARYLTKGSADAWNSATPSNVDQLRKLPPWQQVIENQYEFNRAIASGLAEAGAHRSREVWYEALVADPDACMQGLADWLGCEPVSLAGIVQLKAARKRHVATSESQQMSAFVEADATRLADHCYRSQGSDGVRR